MKRIKEIKVQNFKAFQHEQAFQIDGKNILVYGNNGSGKSSLFWALYTILQSSIKNEDDVKKYFTDYIVSNSSTHQTLKNVFMSEDEESYIKLTVFDIEDESEKIYTISHDLIDTNNIDDTLIQEVNLASDFINYKLLHNFYQASHKREVNLWPVFERDIFPFLTEGTQNWLDDIIKTLTIDVPRTPKGAVISKKRKQRYEAQISNLNSRIQELLDDITVNANQFLKEHFFEGRDVLKVGLSFDKKFEFNLIKNKIWQEHSQGWRHDQLHIKLTVEIHDPAHETNWRKIERVQSFLNEAQLTRIAIGVRVGALRTRPLAAAKLKILVIDDMLVSLDLSNRMDVVRIILNKEEKDGLKFFDGFQKFIFTHDKGFFNLIRRSTDEKEWVYFDFNKDENKNERPIIRENLSPLQNAQKSFDNHEYESAGNHLRLEAEAILTSFLDPEMKSISKDFKSLKHKINESYNLVTSDNYRNFKQKLIRDWDIEKIRKITTNFEEDVELNPGEIARLNSIKSALLKLFVEMNEKNLSKEQALQDVDEILDRILNPASHHSENPLHRAELKDAIEKIQILKDQFHG